MQPDASVCRILMLASNPSESTRLSLDVEVREVRDALLRGRFRDRFEVVHRPATRLQDLQNLLDTSHPHVVHFGGHGKESSGELVFHDHADRPILARVELMAELLEKCDGVVLNACCSARQAEAIAVHGPWAIGTSAPIHDTEARIFARCLYEKLANGCQLEDSFRGAAIQVGLEGRSGSEVLPQLFVGARKLGLMSSYPLTNALVRLWARCTRERLPVSTFHKLLLVSEVAPAYFESVFDVVSKGAAQRVAQWLRAAVERHALSAVGKGPGPLEEDKTLMAARALAREQPRAEIDVRCYLLALLRDRDSKTIAMLREECTKQLPPDGFERIQSTAASAYCETATLRSLLATLNLSAPPPPP